MLGKLLKHEFRATARTMLPMFGVVLVLSLLANLPLPDETTVCPGHEDFSTLGRERRTNPYLLGDWY